MGPGSDLNFEELKDLAEFWSEKGDAISLYFEAPPPAEKAHREEPILAKEKMQQKLRALQGNSAADRTDIARVLDTVASLKGNHRKTRVIFACKRQNLWREFDVPGCFGIRLDVGNSFALAPLLSQQQARKRYLIALADRNRARLLDLEAKEITERQLFMTEEEEPEKIRTTGARKSVHLERKIDEHARRHFADLAERLLQSFERREFDWLIVGCRNDMWPEIEQSLHAELKRVLAGRFAVDPGLATLEEIAQKAQSIVDERDRKDEESIIARVSGSAASDGLGALGLDNVIDALEKREVRTLMFPRMHDGIEHAVALCSHCGHLDRGHRTECDLCGGKMRRFECAEEALLRHALGRSIEMRMLAYTQLPPSQEVAAWLRFKSDRSNAAV